MVLVGICPYNGLAMAKIDYDITVCRILAVPTPLPMPTW